MSTKKNKLLCLPIFIILFMLAFSLNIFASRKLNVIIDNQPIVLESEPVIKDDYTLVPMRRIFEFLNATIKWEASTQTITVTNEDTNIVLQIGSKIAYKNGVEKKLGLAPQIINGSTYIPLRFVAESLGCSVDLKGDTITITSYQKSNGNLIVHYIDVGQAESILIQTPNNKNMLIDAGETKKGAVLSYLNSKGISKLDVVIATHPHKDHISQMAEVINNFEIGSFYMPKVEGEDIHYTNMINALKNNNITPIEAKKGVNINIDSNLKINIIGPCSDDYNDLNNWSAVVHMTYGENSFLFTGDAEELSEREMLASGVNLKADVLKVGHHGDSNASSQNFLNAVKPKYAVISYGKDNLFDHPHQRTLDKLLNVITYVTAKNGNIVITSDGKKIFIG